MTEDSTTPADEHPSDSSWSDDGRFDRQERFVGVGPEGQARLRQRDVLIVGCGALGGSLAQTLARAGVGRLRL
ncbi:MAG: ThiF family adenylyltransferase, partial [Planctomycetota bacterium]